MGPELKPQSSDEIVLGAEYELLPRASVGATYTRRYMNDVIEDLSINETTNYFIGNSGRGIASAFDKAVRDHDAVSVYANKAFSDQWLLQASYTWSYLRGNYSGLYRPDANQLAPNVTSDFDLVTMMYNKTGPLPLDRTHSIKVFGSREFMFSPTMSLDVGLSYRSNSGAPLNVLGSHYIYGSGFTFILPSPRLDSATRVRGLAGRVRRRAASTPVHGAQAFRVPDSGVPPRLMLKPATLAALEGKDPDVSHSVTVSGDFTREYPDEDGVCMVSSLSDARQVVHPEPGTTVDFRYQWSNLRIQDQAAIPGTQWTAELYYSEGDCTATYEAVGVFPAIKCERTQLREEPGAVEHGHHQVEHHDIELLPPHQLQRDGTVLRGGDRVARLEQQHEPPGPFSFGPYQIGCSLSEGT